MGTNYYAVKNGPTTTEPIHIGKNSYGWLFCFQEQNNPHDDPPVVWHTYDDVKNWLRKHTVVNENYVIMDEYDRIVSFTEFFNMVDSIQKDKRALSNPENFEYSTKNVNGYRFTEGDFC